ncbi:MAG: hypothetical protein LKE40_15520 [Spirochaetia bacterium]|nr:hypothetical protein [Spirochaetia bacterium]
MKANLCKEQHGLCAYCMRRVSCNEVEDPCGTIEHYIPQSCPQGQSLQLDWNNLLFVCNGHAQGPLGETTCDKHKGDSRLSFDPQKQSCIDTLSYTRRGKIESTDSHYNKELNDILNLNNKTFRLNRQQVYKTLTEELSKENSFSLGKLRKKKQLLLAEDSYVPYIGVILYFIDRLIQKKTGT